MDYLREALQSASLMDLVHNSRCPQPMPQVFSEVLSERTLSFMLAGVRFRKAWVFFVD